MKKILALLLALVMALGCVGAFAEEPQADAVSFEIPSFTVTWESSVNAETLAALLPMFGVDESTSAIFQAIMPLLAETNGKLVCADNGLQLDVGLKGQTVLTVAGEQVEGGFALASDLLPSYVLTLSNETIEQLMQQFGGQTQDILSNVNMDALAESLTGYVTDFMGVCMSAVTFGDPEIGEFAFEELGLTFNCKTPVLVDTEALKTGLTTMIEQIKNDENFKTLFDSLASSGMPVNLDEITFVMPEVDANVYTNVDEEGNSVDGVTYVAVETVATEGEETVKVNVDVLVDGEGVTVGVGLPDQNMSFSVNVQAADDGAAITLYMDAMGLTAAEVITFSMGETMQLYSETYLMDMENPMAACLVTFSEGGERTFAVQDENKGVIAVEQLMGSDSEALSALQADLMSNGLGQLLAKVAQIMPEEMNNLMTMLYPTETVEEVAE